MRLRNAALLAGLALIVVGCTSTSEGDTAAAETPLTTNELRQLLPGKAVSLSGGGVAKYLANGKYEYHGDRISRGTYAFSNNRVCVDFDGGGFRRCDRYVKKGDQYYLIDGDGQRFRARVS